MKQQKTRAMAVCAMTAALYATLCLAMPMFSYGMIQVRFAEALTLLPIFSPVLIWGVTLGCMLSNLVGFMTGANILGFMDVFFGTAATCIAAWMSWRLRKIRVGALPLPAALPPVLCNAVVIGLELTWVEWMATGVLVPQLFWINALYVGLGQAVACFGLGLPMVALLERTGIARRYFPAAKGGEGTLPF